MSRRCVSFDEDGHIYEFSPEMDPVIQLPTGIAQIETIDSLNAIQTVTTSLIDSGRSERSDRPNRSRGC